MTKSTITINGRIYDAITGMPVAAAATKQPRTAVSKQTFDDISPVASKPNHVAQAPAQTVHRTPERSHTLHRAALTRPIVVTASAPQRELIRKFQPRVVQAEPARIVAEPAITKAAVHPVVTRALQAHTAQPQPAQLSGSDLKEQLIKERLAEVGNTPAKKQKRSSWLGRQPRLATILSSTLALLILGGYLTYITLPSISLKVAASRAGVNATMPEYKPDGYSLDGPITYSPGEVIISYKSNTNKTGYKLVQKATNWDSQAVLDNYVGKLTDNYLTFQERGITVYTFGSKAVWVNGGLLYTLDGDAALSSDQILRLATSI
ncbi:MAG TPA: hypothetical protein VM581_02935 [Magnetospirillaceae bacterium]|nr:hypothetical protein [Magnetospirillaceae bacterium]